MTAPASTWTRSGARRRSRGCSRRASRLPTKRPWISSCGRDSAPPGELTQAAGRGVGMDVVDNEVKKLGGSMRIEIDGRARHALRHPPAVHACRHARADRQRRRRDVCVAVADRRRHHARAARTVARDSHSRRAGSRLRRRGLSSPAPGQPRRLGAVGAAGGGERCVARARARRRELDRAADGFARRQPRDRREDARPAHRERSRRFGGDDPGRREDRSDSRCRSRSYARSHPPPSPHAVETVGKERRWPRSSSTTRSRCAA